MYYDHRYRSIFISMKLDLCFLYLGSRDHHGREMHPKGASYGNSSGSSRHTWSWTSSALWTEERWHLKLKETWREQWHTRRPCSLLHQGTAATRGSQLRSLPSWWNSGGPCTLCWWGCRGMMSCSHRLLKIHQTQQTQQAFPGTSHCPLCGLASMIWWSRDGPQWSIEKSSINKWNR